MYSVKHLQVLFICCAFCKVPRAKGWHLEGRAGVRQSLQKQICSPCPQEIRKR